MNRLAWVILPGFVGLGFAVWWLGFGSPRKLESKTREQRSSVEALTKRLATLETEHDRVRRDLALTRLARGSLSERIESVKAAEDGGEAERETETPASKTRRGDSELQERQEVALQAFEQNLEVRARAEAPDRGWTATVERTFRNKLAALENGPTIESARCGSSLCSVVVSHDRDDAHMDLVNAMNPDRSEFSGQLLVRRHPNPSGGFRTTFYFTRPGQPMPDVQAALSGNYE